MELLSSSKPSAAEPIARRAWFLAAATIAVGAVTWDLTRQHPLLNPAENGTGPLVTIVVFDNNGQRLQTIEVRKLVKTLDEWRKQLDPESFAVTRQQATEFAFHNLYWDNHKSGLYRCVCCGSALFRSTDKYDSDTGWPSFTAPIARENVMSRPDSSLGLMRTEVICTKCDAHLGHLFNDGPPPTYARYCMNSAAIRFIRK